MSDDRQGKRTAAPARRRPGAEARVQARAEACAQGEAALPPASSTEPPAGPPADPTGVERLDWLERLFRDRAGGWISGGEISRKLGISRTVVWKHIHALAQRGFRFEAAPRRGYRLVSAPDRIRLPDLLARLETRTFGRAWKLLDVTESTQNVAHEWAREGAAEGSVVLAERQTAGRGRMGRAWHSPAGTGLWFSIVLKPRVPLQFAPQLTLVAAVALCRTIIRETGVSAGIKWPNDILIGGRKAAGILLESSAEDERIRLAIAGVGISVNLDPEDFPDELRPIATSLKREAGRPIDRVGLLAAFLGELERLYDLYHREGFAPVRTMWEALAVSLHKPIRVRTAEKTVDGVATGLDEFGALLVRTADGRTERLLSGEIWH